MSNLFPLIVDTKRGSTEDGPGIRTTVFFKGCPLSCKWCQNPETIDPLVEIGFYPRNCISCFDCETACPEGAILKEVDVRIDRSGCNRCGKCTEVCPGKGLRSIGRHYNVDTLLAILLRDRVFYETSGGGITLSGGEPTLWPKYTGELLKMLKAEGIHTAIQTCGYFKYDIFRDKMLPWLDLVLYDLKIIDPDKHLQHTGRCNQKIIENFLQLLREDIELIPRIPLIPTFTNLKENLADIFKFITENGIKQYSLLPYNPMGKEKAISIGRPKPSLPQRFMRPDEEKDVYRMFKTIIENRRKKSVA
jgi:pyruvate formate lyase activating enzyme